MEFLKLFIFLLFSLVFTTNTAQLVRFKKIESIEFVLKTEGINSGAKLKYAVFANTSKGKRVNVTSSKHLEVWGEGFTLFKKGALMVDLDSTCTNNQIVVNCKLSKNDFVFEDNKVFKFNYLGDIRMDFSGKTKPRGSRSGGGTTIGSGILGRDGRDGKNGGRGGDGTDGSFVDVYIEKDSVSNMYVVKTRVDDSIFYCYKSAEELPKIYISSNGGQGGNGQKGENGKNGDNAKVTSKGKVKRAGNGGDGGWGGDGGNGGNGGVIRVFINKNAQEIKQNIVVHSYAGLGGKGGIGGKGGTGGKPLEGGEAGKNGKTGKNGANGRHGIPGPKPEFHFVDIQPW